MQRPCRWTFDKHGLKILDVKCGIPDITVRPEGVGAFQAVSEATRSEHMTDAVSVGALWNSLPELAEVPLDGITAHPVIDFLASKYALCRDSDDCSARSSAKSDEFLCATVWVNEETPPLQDRKTWTQGFIARYRGLEGAELWGSDEETFEEVCPGRFGVELCWPAPSTGMQEADTVEFFDVRAPVYRFNDHRYLRPAFQLAKSPPSPLMSWWLLLYSFSMLARYEPRKWTDALDIDKSPDAAALESTPWTQPSKSSPTWCWRACVRRRSRSPNRSPSRVRLQTDLAQSRNDAGLTAAS
ncbi:YaaC family protein [Streptomyces mirabilis]|uniref:YaaC family protein n=2 Tax=Streptomyces TaxID=1883 RepID=UPI00399D6D67